MKFTLYITKDCPACDRVIEFLGPRRTNIAIVNISDPGVESTEPIVSIFPALVGNDRLLAYGDDIIKRLSHPINENGRDDQSR